MLGLKLAVLCLLMSLACCEQEMNVKDDFGTYNQNIKPDLSMDFKIFIEGYSQECYYVDLREDDIFHFICNVLKGGDTKVTIMIADPKNTQIFYKHDETFAWYDTSNITNPGIHTVCINNRDSHEKVVYLNFISFPKNKYAKQNTMDEARVKEIEQKQLNDTHSTMMDFTRYIEMNIYKITRAQTLKRIRMAAETYYIDDLNDFVLYLGLGQSAIIIISALVQTYFIKKLFESTGYNPMELGSIQFISPPDKSYY